MVEGNVEILLFLLWYNINIVFNNSKKMKLFRYDIGNIKNK